MVFFSADEIPDPIKEVSQEITHVPVVAGLVTSAVIILCDDVATSGHDLIAVAEGHQLDSRGFIPLLHGEYLLCGL